MFSSSLTLFIPALSTLSFSPIYFDFIHLSSLYVVLLLFVIPHPFFHSSCFLAFSSFPCIPPVFLYNSNFLFMSSPFFHPPFSSSLVLFSFLLLSFNSFLHFVRPTRSLSLFLSFQSSSFFSFLLLSLFSFFHSFCTLIPYLSHFIILFSELVTPPFFLY